jgi:DNA-directed RNA polymerase subunit RPC12/RpoP
MGMWRSRIYTCKHCNKSVEIFPKDEYICKDCNKSLLSNSPKRGLYIGMNPMARQTKMEFSTQSINESIKDFRK